MSFYVVRPEKDLKNPTPQYTFGIAAEHNKMNYLIGRFGKRHVLFTLTLLPADALNDSQLFEVIIQNNRKYKVINRRTVELVGKIIPQEIILDILSNVKTFKNYPSDDEKKQPFDMIRSKSYENKHLSIIEGAVPKITKQFILGIIKQYYDVDNNSKCLFSDFKKHTELIGIVYSDEILAAIIYKNTKYRFMGILHEIYVGGLALKKEYIKPLQVNAVFNPSNVLSLFNQFVSHKNKIPLNTDISRVFTIANFIVTDTPLCLCKLKIFIRPVSEIKDYIELYIEKYSNKEKLWGNRRYLNTDELLLAFSVLNIRISYGKDGAPLICIMIDTNSPKYTIDYSY